MYLKKLYYNSKFWFCVASLFIFIQLSLDIRRDASVSPFFHYGMYSTVIEPKKIYVVPEVIVNGNALQTKRFSPPVWDKIIQPIILFENQDKWNRQIFTEHIQPLLKIKDSTKYINSMSVKEFQLWYQDYLENILKTKITSLQINYTITAYSNNKLLPAN